MNITHSFHPELQHMLVSERVYGSFEKPNPQSLIHRWMEARCLQGPSNPDDAVQGTHGIGNPFLAFGIYAPLAIHNVLVLIFPGL